MKLPEKMGADRKKIAILGGLVVVLIAVFFLNRDSGPSTGPPGGPAAAAAGKGPFAIPPAAKTATRSPAVPQRAGGRGERRAEDFHPTLKLKEEIDVTRIDPTLKLDLLARLKNAPSEPGSRGSVFDFGAAPPPKVDPVKPGPMVAGRGPAPGAPSAETAKASGPPPKPPPPPIPLKFYGYSNTSRGGQRRAFFLDGEDIQVAGENELIRNRYKVIRIGVNSVVVEDTTNKNQQTLPLVEELSS
jgi:hypothetical protein